MPDAGQPPAHQTKIVCCRYLVRDLEVIEVAKAITGSPTTSSFLRSASVQVAKAIIGAARERVLQDAREEA